MRYFRFVLGAVAWSACAVWALAATALPPVAPVDTVQDTARAEESANGITNISEFGSYKNAAEFPALLEMSTYQSVVDGTAYPSVVLVHGINDPRVDVWYSAKTAARLQAATSSGQPILPPLVPASRSRHGQYCHPAQCVNGRYLCPFSVANGQDHCKDPLSEF